MAQGVVKFDITDVNIVHDDERPFAFGSVLIRRDEVITGDLEVGHKLLLTVRITPPADGTVEGLWQAIFEKAREELRLALAALEGKTAQQLLIAARDQARRERKAFEFPS